MPQRIRFLNETKLGKSAADNLRWSCTCSKHGLSLAGALAPGDLEQWIRKTMLSGCAAYGTLGQQVIYAWFSFWRHVGAYRFELSSIEVQA